MTYSAVDFVSDQLSAAAPGAEWFSMGVDRAAELAAILVRNSIIDLSRLRIVPVSFTLGMGAYPPDETVSGLALEYDGKRFGFLGTPDRADNGVQVSIPRDVPGGKYGETRRQMFSFDVRMLEGARVAWSAEGHGNVGYDLTTAATGFAIVPHWASSSDAAEIRGIIKTAAMFAVSFVLPAAGFSAANAIGGAVLGAPTALAYPGLATAIGQAALTAAFTGESVSELAKNAALSYAAAGAGDYAGALALDASNVEIVGKLTEAATRAYISGGDVERAVSFSLLQNAGSIVDIFESKGPTMDYYSADEYNAVFPDPVFDPAPAVPEVFAPVSFADLPALSELPPDAQWTMAPLAIPDVTIEEPMRADSQGFSMGDAKTLINTVSDAALQALKVTAAYRALNPQVNTAARTVNPATGRVTSALDTGIVQTRDASGRVVNARPPVGQPQSTVSGNVMVNNGDGTYSLIAPNGTRRTIKYSGETASQGFGITPGLVFAGLGVAVALVAFARRRT